MALLLLAGAGYAYYQKNKTQQQAAPPLDPEIDLEGKTSVRFLPLELDAAILQGSMATITYYEDSNYDETARFLRRRVDAILKANPWLGGWLYPGPVSNSEGGSDKDSTRQELQLWYDPTGACKTPGAFQSFEVGVFPFSSSTSYARYREALPAANVKVASTQELVGRNSPLWRVSMIPDAARPMDRFVVVISMCRLLGDACTYYQLANMVLQQHDDMTVEALNPHRHRTYMEHAAARLGLEEVSYMMQTNPTLWDKQQTVEKREVLLFTVNRDWLAQERVRVSLDTSSNSEGNEDEDVVELSDGAILISWFFRTVQPTVGFQTHSMRSALDTLETSHAGNYQAPIPLFPAMAYDTPHAVQESLRTGKRRGNAPLPKARFGTLASTATFAFGGDWTQFLPQDDDGPASSLSTVEPSFSERSSQGTSYLRPTLHLPFIDPSDLQSLPKRVSAFFLFSAAPNKLGALCACSKTVTNQIVASGVMGETIAVV